MKIPARQMILILLIMFTPILSIHSVAENNSNYFYDKISGGVNLRMRNEYWNTFEKLNADTDNSYNFFLTRARGWLDYEVDNFRIHLMGQGVKAFDFPDNSAFGPGGLYFDASDDKSAPGNFQIAEAYFEYKDTQGIYLSGGRIPIKEGTEVLYEDSPKLNWVINQRLSERLIGTWDWTNIGRRFDGASGGYHNRNYNLNLFGSWVTFGGFDFDDGYWKDLDNVVVIGGSFTVKKDVFIANSQLKLFNYFYYDDRDPAKDFAGDELKINTIGVNLAGAYPAGIGEIDLLLWGAYQFGDFGSLDQSAWAFIAEAGYQFINTPWKPWVRAGIAYASGDDDPDDSDNGTFFNYVPTNHKFYGYVDANAFSNLINTYIELIISPHQKIGFTVDGHLFWLASDDEVWIGGSGPFNDSAFGYDYRNPVEGNDIDSELGGEIDLTLILKVVEYLTFEAGYSHFFGGDGVSVVFDKEDQLDWFYLQVTLNFDIKPGN